MKRKGNATPDRSLYPCAPRNPSEIDFELRRFVDMKTPYEPSNPEEYVTDIISKAHAPIPPVDVEVGEYVWLPDGQKADRGRWSQEVSFHSYINLRFTPTFLTEELKIKVRCSMAAGFAVELAHPFATISVHTVPEDGVPWIGECSPHRAPYQHWFGCRVVLPLRGFSPHGGSPCVSPILSFPLLCCANVHCPIDHIGRPLPGPTSESSTTRNPTALGAFAAMITPEACRLHAM